MPICQSLSAYFKAKEHNCILRKNPSVLYCAKCAPFFIVSARIPEFMAQPRRKIVLDVLPLRQRPPILRLIFLPREPPPPQAAIRSPAGRRTLPGFPFCAAPPSAALPPFSPIKFEFSINTPLFIAKSHIPLAHGGLFPGRFPFHEAHLSANGGGARPRPFYDNMRRRHRQLFIHKPPMIMRYLPSKIVFFLNG